MPNKTGRDDAQIEADNLIVRAIGEELRRARKAKGWRRPDLVGHVGSHLPVNTYACYEQGTRPCPTARLVEICRALGVAPGELLDLALQRIETDLHTDGLRVDLHRLTSDDQDPPALLRQWAKNHLALDSPSVIQVSWEVIQEMAVLFDLSVQDMAILLKKFAPESVLQQDK